jgi:hypothetical protein
MEQTFPFPAEIKSVKVITGDGPDHVVIETTLPDGCWPYTGTADFRTEVAHNAGVEYVRKHFNREPDLIISTSVHTRIPFSKH